MARSINGLIKFIFLRLHPFHSLTLLRAPVHLPVLEMQSHLLLCNGTFGFAVALQAS